METKIVFMILCVGASHYQGHHNITYSNKNKYCIHGRLMLYGIYIKYDSLS